MRRDSFLGQVLTAVARSTPATSPVRELTKDTGIARPTSQLLMAIARTTPAFTPRTKQTLNTRLRVSRQPGPTANMPHAVTDAGSAADVIEFGHRIPSARQRRSYRQALVVALATLAIPLIIATTLTVKAALHPRNTPNLYPVGSVSSNGSPGAAPSALTKALTVTNQSDGAKGLLPPSTCNQQGSNVVTCTSPFDGISGAVFQTFPKPTALYDAYMAKVASLNSGQFKQNFSDCTAQITYGEVAWNYLSKHTKSFTVQQMATGSHAAGRVFCNYTRGFEYMVWTQNDGYLLGIVAGPLHSDVWNWWEAVHQNIVLSPAAAMATLGSYLARSASVRPTIQAAINGVQGCSESPASGEATLQHAINTRQDILNALPTLSVTGLPSGTQLVSTLTTAMQDSIAAEKDYQSWMRDFASSGSPCGSDPSQDSNYAAAVNVSGAATTAKNAFVAIWDPMAPRYGQPVYSSTGF